MVVGSILDRRWDHEYRKKEKENPKGLKMAHLKKIRLDKILKPKRTSKIHFQVIYRIDLGTNKI